MKAIQLLLLLLGLVALAHGHAHLTVPASRRAGQNTKRLTPFPAGAASNTCGGTQNADPGAKAVVATYTAGSTIDVKWVIEAAHASAPGIRLALIYSANDKFDNNVLAKNLAAGGNGEHTYSLTLPADKTCDNCVLQWMWETQADGGFYIGCSDIKIVAPVVATTPPTSPPTNPPIDDGTGTDDGTGAGTDDGTDTGADSASGSSRTTVLFSSLGLVFVGLLFSML